MTQEKLNEKIINTIMDDIGKNLLVIEKAEVSSIQFFDKQRGTTEKIVDWVGNRITSSLFRYSSIYMDATVQILYTKNKQINLLRLGVPDKIVGSSTFDFGSLLPEEITTIPDYISESFEFFELFDEDAKAIKVAKQLANTLTKIVNEK